MAVLVSHPIGHVRQATEGGPVGEVGLLRGAILALPLEQARAERKPEHSPSKKRASTYKIQRLDPTKIFLAQFRLQLNFSFLIG